MPHLRPVPLLCSLLLAASPCLAAPKFDLERITPVPSDQPVPIMDFFRAPIWREPKLNPSGTHIAGLVDTSDDKYRLLVYDIKTQKFDLIGGDGDKDVYDYTWLDDQRLVFFLSSEKLYGLGLFAVEVGRIRDPYPLLQYCGATLVSVPRDSRRKPLVWLRHESLENGRDGGVAVVDSGGRNGTFVNLARAGASMVEFNAAKDNNARHIIKTYPVPKGGITYGYMADSVGHLAYAFTSNNGELAMHHLDADLTWIKSPIDLETIDVLASSNGPGRVLARVPGEPDKPTTVRFLDVASGKAGDALIEDQDYDFTGWFYRNPGTDAIVGAMYQRAGPHAVWFDEGYRTIQKVLDQFFPGQVVRILGNNEAGSLFLIATFNDRQPTVYHWVDLEKRTAGLIKNSRPWIDAKRMRPMQILRYKTRDGRKLDAYVTLPEGASKKNPAPLVVLPHGGPWVRDTWGFDSQAQFLASRGYAVIQPNYRGSPGYDWMFPDEDQWAFRKMHDDVTDATKMLIASGLVDSSRVAIMGGSFGAYLALSGVAHEPSMYRCAVTIAGVFDWATVLREEKYDQFTTPSYGRMLRKLGDPKKHKEKFEAISPLRHVANVRVPLFVAHGKEDNVAAISESKRLVAELEKHNIPYEKLFVSGEGHGMGHLKNEVALYTRIEAFLAKHLAPIAAPAAGSAAAGSP
jgi:acetyl esterase/lipase